MNKEKKLQLYLILGIVFVVFISFFVAHNLGLIYLIIFSFVIFCAVFFILFEFYLRIQHNIDNIDNVKIEIEGTNKLVEKFLETAVKQIENTMELLCKDIKARLENLFDLGSQNTDKIFLTKSSLEYKMLDLKYNIEKNMNEIKGAASKTYLQQFLLEIYATEGQKDSLFKIAPDVFSHKTVLYIGASKERSLFLEEFIKAGYKITILEVFRQNIEFLKNLPFECNIIEGDVRSFAFKDKFDVVFWWHGPEHVEESKLKDTLKILESSANKLVVLGCPWGSHPHGEIYGNPYEKHLSQYYEGYFEKFGYKTNYFGRRDVICSNITAVKYINLD